ncbi:unnamed protein product [Urochloa humidicola]
MAPVARRGDGCEVARWCLAAVLEARRQQQGAVPHCSSKARRTGALVRAPGRKGQEDDAAASLSFVGGVVLRTSHGCGCGVGGIPGRGGSPPGSGVAPVPGRPSSTEDADLHG